MSTPGLSTAHSVVEPTPRSKRLAMTVVVLYALITLVPLMWILLTSIKSPPDSISYPPKVVFEPSIEGFCNLFTTLSRQTEEYIRSLPVEQVGPQIYEVFDTNYREGRVNDPTLPARLIVNLLVTNGTGEVVSIYDARGKELLASSD